MHQAPGSQDTEAGEKKVRRRAPKRELPGASCGGAGRLEAISVEGL